MYLECNIYIVSRGGDAFTRIKIKANPKSDWRATALFHQDSSRGDCWTHDHCSGLAFPAGSCSSPSAYLDTERDERLPHRHAGRTQTRA